MATDSTLVKGAYDANKGYEIDRGGISRAVNEGIPALDKAIDKSGKREDWLENRIKRRKKKEEEEKVSLPFTEQREKEEKIKLQKIEIDNIYNDAIDQGDNDISNQYESTEDILKQLKTDIPESKLKNTGVKVLNQLSNGVQKFKDLKERIVTAHRERKNGTGFQKNMDPETDKLLADVAAGNIPFSTTNIDGDYDIGFKLANGDFLNVGDVERLLEDNEVDIESQNNINSIVDAQISAAENANPYAKFKSGKVSRSIRNIVKRGNIKSLVNDEVFGGTSFIEDLDEHLSGVSYGDLGVDPMVYDKDGDGVLTTNDRLSSAERDLLIDELINNNPGMLEDMVVDYFTQYVKTQWDNTHIGPPTPEETLSRNALGAMTQNIQMESKSRLDESIKRQIG